MKKALFIIGLLAVAFFATAQTLEDLSKFHNGNIIWEEADENFTDLKAVGTAHTAINDGHGFMSFKDSSETITVSADSTWYAVTSATNTLWTTANLGGMTGAGDSLTITIAGDYSGVLSLSLSSAADDTLQIGLLKNNALISSTGRVMTIGAEIVNISLPFYLGSLAVGDDLVPVVQQLISTQDMIIHCGQLLLTRQE